MAENPTTKTGPSAQNVVVEDEMDAGQAKLYSPDYAAAAATATPAMSAGAPLEQLKRNLGAIKDRLLEKLSASSVPKDALENARNFLETVVRDVTLAAHGLTRDALLRIRGHLVEFLPSLSPAASIQMVDEAEKEVNEGMILGGERSKL